MPATTTYRHLCVFYHMSVICTLCLLVCLVTLGLCWLMVLLAHGLLTSYGLYCKPDFFSSTFCSYHQTNRFFSVLYSKSKRAALISLVTLISVRQGSLVRPYRAPSCPSLPLYSKTNEKFFSKYQAQTKLCEHLIKLYCSHCLVCILWPLS